MMHFSLWEVLQEVCLALNMLSKEHPPPSTFLDTARESVLAEPRFGKPAPDPAEDGLQPLSPRPCHPGRAPRCEGHELPRPGRCLRLF